MRPTPRECSAAAGSRVQRECSAAAGSRVQRECSAGETSAAISVDELAERRALSGCERAESEESAISGCELDEWCEDDAAAGWALDPGLRTAGWVAGGGWRVAGGGWLLRLLRLLLLLLWRLLLLLSASAAPHGCGPGPWTLDSSGGGRPAPWTLDRSGSSTGEPPSPSSGWTLDPGPSPGGAGADAGAPIIRLPSPVGFRRSATPAPA